MFRFDLRSDRFALGAVCDGLEQILADVLDVRAAANARMHIALFSQLLIDLQDRIAGDAQFGRKVARRWQAGSRGQMTFQNGSTYQPIQAMICRTIIAWNEVLLQPFRENERFQIGSINFN